MNLVRKISLLVFLLFVSAKFPYTFAQTSDDCQSLSPQDKVTCYEKKVSDLRGQANTLSSQIAVMDSQINLTQARIDSTKQQISDLVLDIDTANKKITNLQSSLDDLVKVLLNRMVVTYEVGQIQPFQILLTSNNANNFFSRLNYLKIAQSHDKQLIYLTQQAKNDYQNQKNIYEDKKKKIEALKKQLEGYTAQLEQNKADKQQLLSETQGNEATYQQLLSQARAQLAALSGFANSVGISLIPHGSLPSRDGWGNYYNQRDSNWGNNFIGSSDMTIASVGCLLTSYSMVSSHYGSSMTPADVASNNSYFFSGTAYFNQPGPAPAGHSVNYISNPSLDSLRNELNAGHIVIAGLSSNGGPYPTHYSDHWVVLRSVNGDSFSINDPLYSDGMNAVLSNHYSGWTIIEARIYQ